jgi:hypothetical protein
MSLFKFNDSNFLHGSNISDVVATANTYNGYQFKIVADEAVAIATDAEAKTVDIYVMNNIINKPEIENTDDYYVVDGENIRAWRLKNHIGQKINMSQDLVYFRDTGTAQVETATVVLEDTAIGTSGNAEVIVTANGMTGSPKTLAVAVVSGTKQVETATVVGTITTAGRANCIVTSEGMAGSPLLVPVDVVLNDDANAIALAIRTALTANATVSAKFTVSGTDASVVLTAKVPAANDDTLNIAISDGEGEGACVGITEDATSDNTTTGVDGDTPSDVAEKIRTALTSDANIGHAETGYFTVGGTGANITLTAKVAKANDTTMNISIDNDNCAGIVADLTSTTTTDGKVPITTNALMWADLDVGDLLVPRTVADTTNTMQWKKVSTANDYNLYLEVINKTAFGLFTVDKNTDTVLGGLLCRIKSAI